MSKLEPGGASPLRARIAWAGVLGCTAVAGGAFAAHGAADALAKSLLQTGGEYGLIHALAALASLGVARLGARPAGWATWCFLAGGSLFSGSLYALAFSHAVWFGAITPIGGLLMLAGWALLAWAGATLRSAP
jgi:uncharacterized membrane protein YgdD (TMEM256/DUF423 family)